MSDHDLYQSSVRAGEVLTNLERHATGVVAELGNLGNRLPDICEALGQIPTSQARDLQSRLEKAVSSLAATLGFSLIPASLPETEAGVRVAPGQQLEHITGVDDLLPASFFGAAGKNTVD